MDRKTTKKEADATEVTLKQISISVPATQTKATMAKLRSTAQVLHSNPGTCMDNTLPPTDLPAVVSFAHVKMGMLSAEQRNIVSHLDVGGVSEPLLGPDALRMVILCEKVEASNGSNLPDAETVRQQLFAEKLELEAQKQLRNLRRDAFIDIKGAP